MLSGFVLEAFLQICTVRWDTASAVVCWFISEGSVWILCDIIKCIEYSRWAQLGDGQHNVGACLYPWLLPPYVAHPGFILGPWWCCVLISSWQPVEE